MKNQKAYFGLPEKVKFCKRCVISNQRPSTPTIPGTPPSCPISASRKIPTRTPHTLISQH